MRLPGLPNPEPVGCLPEKADLSKKGFESSALEFFPEKLGGTAEITPSQYVVIVGVLGRGIFYTNEFTNYFTNYTNQTLDWLFVNL